MDLDNKTLRKLQLAELEILIEADRICRKNHIKYSIIAGTLLGAIRHGGFIPWDDDADIAMLRPEYEKFRKACEKDLDHENFYFQDHRNTKGYRWGYGKLRMKNTVFLRENQEHMPYDQGICIDVFPLDGVPNNYLSRCIQNFECFCIRKILWSEVGKKSDNSSYMRIIYQLLSRIPENRVFDIYHRLINLSNKKKGRMVRILMYPTPNSEWGYYRCWYENNTDTEFEGHVFQGIRDTDSYLSFKFGSYMELPPENMRKVHPVSKLVLPELQMKNDDIRK